MHRIIPRKVIFLVIAWFVLGGVALLELLNQVAHWELKNTALPAALWLVFGLLLWNPIWRWLWRIIPSLNRWVFPDLNGEWDVELCSNWSRQRQMLDAASSPIDAIDMERCAETSLAKLEPKMFRAEISQSWWSIEMTMTNPNADSPIEKSETIFVEPIGKNGRRPAGICYFFTQTNATDNVADDVEFNGAAQLNFDEKTGNLSGHFWSARMWRRAMNTAGTAKFTRANDVT